jgi:hypothetical protein
MLRTALTLASRGLHVFPCLPRDKRPATEHGFLDATRDAEVIKSWWRAEPTANVAVRTGAVSNLVVLDVDGAEAALMQLEAEHGALPPSVEVITARGRHIWFRHPGGTVPNSASRVAPHIDVRGDGGYVLAPPSVHPDGRRYSWSVDCAGAVATAPDWLLAKLAAPNGNGSATPSTDWQELIKGVAEGARDNSLTKLTGYLLRRRVDPFVTLELIRMFNVARCSPPLPGSDIDRIVNSVCGAELRRRGLDHGRG